MLKYYYFDDNEILLSSSSSRLPNAMDQLKLNENYIDLSYSENLIVKLNDNHSQR